MPELKNLFIKGKMNKDLDERLVPQGEYRDALNVSVSYSEGSDVGALQNILGNQQRIQHLQSESPDVYIDLSFPANSTCIGTVRDTENDKIYWFGTSNGEDDEADFIAEYNPAKDSVDIILCDAYTSPATRILNFSTSNLITGVAVLDGVLYFTDDLNEPRQVDIEYWRGVTATDFTISTNLSDDRISLYKKGPLNAPIFDELSESLRGGNGTRGNTEVVTEEKNISSIDIDGTIDDFIISTDGTASGNDPNYLENDIIILVDEYYDTSSVLQRAEARIKITNVESNGHQFDVTLISKTSNIRNKDVSYVALLEEDEALFELKFALFAYRYKYNNGQFSTISPFSYPAFIPGDFKYDATNGFNEAMENQVRAIKLKGWGDEENFGTISTGKITPSQTNYASDIKEIEILYKETTGTNIYIADTLSLDSNGEFDEVVTIKDEQIFKAIQSNQILRPFDSIPKKAKALEITGNRLIFGNYLQNFNFTDKPVFDVSISDRNSNNGLSQNLSIKSGRTYQLGIVFQDKFGRQTPVFTDKSGIIKNKFNNSAAISEIEVATTVTPPSDATHYKYFVKEVSNEYYNLALSNFYEDSEGFIYLSFPSSEVNKISENDYLILKKTAGQEGDLAYTHSDNRFKVLDSSSEVPKAITTEDKVVSKAVGVIFGDTFSAGSNNAGDDEDEGEQLTRKPGETPYPGHSTFLLHQANPVGSPSNTDVDDTIKPYLAEDKLFYFRKGNTGETSNIYKIQKAVFGDDGSSYRDAEISVATPFGQDVQIIYNDPDDEDSTYSNVEMVFVERTETALDTDTVEFKNKFFIKLFNNPNLKDALQNVQSIEDLSVVDSRYMDESGFQTVGQGNRRYQFDEDDYSIGETQIQIETYLAYNYAESQYDDSVFDDELKTGNYIRFGQNHNGLYNESDATNGDWSVIYRMKEVSSYVSSGGGGSVARKNYDITLDKPLKADIESRLTKVDILKFDARAKGNLEYPPIFEVEPEDGVLEIYYETGKTYPVSDLDGNTTRNLLYANCFSFENGAESDRIRDDFNQKTLGKGTRVSTIFEDNYEEERVKSGLIFSGLYNSKNGINRLNQFIIAENITEEANPIYGSIQKLNTRDTDLTLLCDDKILKVPARKDLLFQADGNPQVTSTDRFLGTIIPYAGNYGCQHPESFADHIYRAYFVDKTRGKVLRLGGDGITEISNYGMKDYFKDKLSSSYNKIVGSYDENKDQYNVSLVTDFIVTSDTISFSESVNGWPSRKSFIPEAGISLNNMYYTFKDGKIFSHDNENRNTFYSSVTASEVTSFLNGNPGNIKNFRTLNYQGDSGWDASASGVTTNTDRGTVLSFVEKEGKFYNYIQGLNNTTKSSLDLKALNVQGLGTPTNISGNDATFSELNNALQVGDVVYNNSNDTGRTVTGISGNTITLDGAPTNAFNFFAKNNKFNTSGVLGYFLQVKLSHDSTDKKELYSIGSEVSLSS